MALAGFTIVTASLAVVVPTSPAAGAPEHSNTVQETAIPEAISPEVETIDLDDADIEELEDHLDELESAAEAAESQVSDLTQEQVDAEALVDKASATLADHDQHVDAVSTAISDSDTLTMRLGALVESTRGQSEVVTSAMETIDLHQPRAQAISTEVQTAHDIVEELDDQISDVSDLIEELEAEAEAEAEAQARAQAEAEAEEEAAQEEASSSESDSSSSSSSSDATYNSSAAQNAVDFAYDQIGKPYVFGSSGPDSYDCSGLTQAAYNVSGISLAHNAAEQISQTSSISRGDLQPGDLVFYQSGGHVGIYIGSGEVIHSPRAGDVVKVAPVDMMPPTSYGRVG